MRKRLSLKIPTFLASVVLSGMVVAQEPPGDRENGDAFNGLPEKEQARLREAMRSVWSDPSVVQSREEINESVKAYKESIRKALLKKDPELGPILAKLDKDSSSHVKHMMVPPGVGRGGPRFGDGKGGKGGPGSPDISAFDRMTRFAPYLNDLTEEQRNKYIAISDRVRGSDEIKSILARLALSNEKDNEIRAERTQLFGELRKTFHAKMIEADPEMAALLPKTEPKKDRSEAEKSAKGPSPKPE